MNHLIPEDLSWCLQRLPAPWRDMMQARPNQLFLAGGFIRSCIAREDVNDADFFAPNHDTAAACALLVAGPARLTPIRTDNAYTVPTKPVPAQFIHRWTFTNPVDAIASFDFTIARAAIWWDGQAWASACDPRFYPDLAAKRLVYCMPERIEEAGGSLLRVLKFYQRGYRIPLDSLGAVIARLAGSVRLDEIDRKVKAGHSRETELAFVLTGLLREVDPAIDPTHAAHLPSSTIPPPAIAARQADPLA